MSVENIETAGKQVERASTNEPYQNVDLFYENGKRKSRATVLIEIGEQLEKFHDSNGETYVIIPINGHNEIWAMKSKKFKEWLSSQYYKLSKSGTDRSSVNDALSTLAAMAKDEGTERQVYLRVTGDNDRIYIDLCDPTWRVIEVDAAGWRILDKSPVMFIRNKGMKALPEPEKNGCIDHLWNNLNIEEKFQPLILGYLIAAFRPQGPYPILTLVGEQGTAKSTFVKMLRLLIDPSTVPLRSPPKDERDFLVGATNNWMVTLDNLSGIKPWLSDSICRLATGGGFTTRELYTDTDQILIEIQRPVIVNGIDDVATRPDFAERSILLHLTPIPPLQRITERKLWKEFKAHHANILGGILNTLSSAIQNIKVVHLETHPRMADFVEWVVAAEMGSDEMSGFLDAYNENQKATTIAGVEASPVGKAVISLMKSENGWIGSMMALHKSLEQFIDEDTKHSKAWPKSPNWLSNYLRRIGSSLRKIGIDITLPEQSEDRQMHIMKIPQSGKIAVFAELPEKKEVNGQKRQFFRDVGNDKATYREEF